VLFIFSAVAFPISSSFPLALKPNPSFAFGFCLPNRKFFFAS
jgi:hypothetical protein